MGEHFLAPHPRARRMTMQYGSLVRTSRSRGPDVWLFRWSEHSYDGKRVCRKKVIGTIDDYSDREAARRSVANLIAKVNSGNRRTASDSIRVAQLCNHFEQRELGSTNTWRSYATKSCYAVYLRRWIVPQWGDYELCNVKLSRSNPGFVDCHCRKAVVPRSAT